MCTKVAKEKEKDTEQTEAIEGSYEIIMKSKAKEYKRKKDPSFESALFKVRGLTWQDITEIREIASKLNHLEYEDFAEFFILNYEHEEAWMLFDKAGKGKK